MCALARIIVVAYRVWSAHRANGEYNQSVILVDKPNKQPSLMQNKFNNNL